MSDRIVILVDDGLATNAKIQAAVVGIKQQQPRQIIVVMPVSAVEICNMLEEVDTISRAETP